MENTEKRKAILFVRVEPYEVYFCRDDAPKFRLRTLEIYCQKNNIEPLVFHWIIGQYQNFENDFFPSLKQNLYGFTRAADLLLMHDSHELSGSNIAPVTMIHNIRELGLEVLFIKEFAIEIGRY